MSQDQIRRPKALFVRCQIRRMFQALGARGQRVCVDSEMQRRPSSALIHAGTAGVGAASEFEALGKETAREAAAPGKRKKGRRGKRNRLRGGFWKKAFLTVEVWSVELTIMNDGVPVTPPWIPVAESSRSCGARAARWARCAGCR